MTNHPTRAEGGDAKAAPKDGDNAAEAVYTEGGAVEARSRDIWRWTASVWKERAEEAEAKIAQLTAAGDALAEAASRHVDTLTVCHACRDALTAWQQATASAVLASTPAE